MAKIADHDTTRRMVKARQQARKQADAAAARIANAEQAQREQDYRAAAAERIRQERRIQASELNGKRLLAKAIQGFLRISASDPFFFRNVSDVKRAAKASKTRFQWSLLESGDFVIGLPEKKAA